MDWSAVAAKGAELLTQALYLALTALIAYGTQWVRTKLKTEAQRAAFENVASAAQLAVSEIHQTVASELKRSGRLTPESAKTLKTAAIAKTKALAAKIDLDTVTKTVGVPIEEYLGALVEKTIVDKKSLAVAEPLKTITLSTAEIAPNATVSVGVLEEEE